MRVKLTLEGGVNTSPPRASQPNTGKPAKTASRAVTWAPAIDYDELTVVQLREALHDRGLPVSGTKSVLIDRLEESHA